MTYNASINAQELGIYFQDYNFLMGLSGALCGFVFLFFAIYIVTK